MTGRFTRLLALLAALVATYPAEAQQYPSQVIKFIVPYPPGGAVDVTGRLLADYLEKEMKASFVVENRAGAAGTIGARFVARAEPDGYTILLSGLATHAFAPSLFKSLPYDPVADFEPITQVTDGPLILAVSSKSDIKSVDQFVAAMKAKGSNANHASNGFGTLPHLSVELLKQTAGFQSTHVAFRGGNEAVTALLGAQVDFTFNHVPIVLPQAQDGAFRALASSGATRGEVLKDVPTLKELGYDVVATAWFGLFAPAKTPRPIIDKIYQAVAKVAASTDLKKRLLAQGDDIVIEGPEKFRTLQLAEIKKWEKIITEAKIEKK